jgi:hypothetical protein
VRAQPVEPTRRPDAPTSPPAPTAIAAERPSTPPTIVATGVYFSGTVKLELGGRYGFMVDGNRFRILGPLSPSIVALDRPLAGLTISTAHGRLLVAVANSKSDELMVFTSVVGASLEKVAEAIQQAASQTEGPE